MKKIIAVILLLCINSSLAWADIGSEHYAQTKIDQIGTNILNTNKIQTRIVFTYNKKTRKNVFKRIKGLQKNNIIIYDGLYQYAETDDEIAAILARQIYFVNKVYNKFINKFNVTKDPKFYELITDKKAVDYMVTANYNPLALITYLNKTTPEYKLSLRHNKTSKRLIAIYEYILLKYPDYIKNDDDYINNPYYQNFLLNTVNERKFIKEKIYKNGESI